MPTNTTVETLYIGNFATDLNPNNDSDSEQAPLLVGQTFGSAASPLHQGGTDADGAGTIVTFIDANDDGNIRPGGMGDDGLDRPSTGTGDILRGGVAGCHKPNVTLTDGFLAALPPHMGTRAPVEAHRKSTGD